MATASSEHQPAILLRGLVKSYGPVRALSGVDLAVPANEIFGFLGPNGAGKTTTIRCILDLIRPDSGTIRVFGIDPQRRPTEVRAQIGYLPGELSLDDRLTGLQLLQLLAAMRRNRVEWSYVDRLADRLQIDLKTKIRNLSKGNRQKVGVIQALMHRPRLLILDEPTLGLDPLMQRELLAILKEARDEGSTVFFSSHIMSEVEQIADHVAIIRHGTIAEVAPIDQLLRRSLRRVRIRFKTPIDPSPLGLVPGVHLLSARGQEVTLEVTGPMDALIKTLSAFSVLDMETERPSLEEVFLAYYAKVPQEETS